MSRPGLRSRAITRTYAAMSVAALSAALCWPATSLASPDYADRALPKDSIERAQPKSLSTVSTESAPIYKGYYGPVIRPSSVFGGKW